MSRTAARETAARLIYQWEMNGGSWRTALEYTLEEPRLDARDMTYIEDIMERVPERVRSIDCVIEDISDRWRVDRMGKMDLAILRLAVYEIGWRGDIPESVSINEAVELAKRYGSDETPSFINGMLSTLSKRTKEDNEYFKKQEELSDNGIADDELAEAVDAAEASSDCDVPSGVDETVSKDAVSNALYGVSSEK